MIKAYSYRVYPTDDQMSQLIQWRGSLRFVYNHLLEYVTKAYKRRKENISEYDMNKFISDVLKKAYPWLKEVPAQALQQVSKNLRAAMVSFFKGVSNYPRFKKKGRNECGIIFPQHISLDPKKGSITVPKLGLIKAKVHVRPKGVLRKITIKVKPSGEVYASCLYETGVDAVEASVPENPNIIGVDVGISHLAVTSKGKVYENPSPLRKEEKKLKHLQKMLSKKAKGSNNWKKLKSKIAKAHEHIAAVRRNKIHEMTKEIVCKSQADVIVIEDLNVSGMMKNHNIAKHIQDASLYEIRRQFEYKCAWYGKKLIIADRWYASSKNCSVCGWHNSDLKLSDRVFECPICHTKIDRDWGAALNLEIYGMIALAGDAGNVKPLETPSVDDRVETHLKSKVSMKEEKEPDTGRSNPEC